MIYGKRCCWTTSIPQRCYRHCFAANIGTAVLVGILTAEISRSSSASSKVCTRQSSSQQSCEARTPRFTLISVLSQPSSETRFRAMLPGSVSIRAMSLRRGSTALCFSGSMTGELEDLNRLYKYVIANQGWYSDEHDQERRNLDTSLPKRYLFVRPWQCLRVVSAGILFANQVFSRDRS